MTTRGEIILEVEKLLAQGLIKEYIREDGKTTYGLTEKGKRYAEEKLGCKKIEEE